MSQITRCPQCQTRFKVVDDQLRISDGWVRCGKCKSVFDALAHLVQRPDAGVVENATDKPAAAPEATPVVAATEVRNHVDVAPIAAKANAVATALPPQPAPAVVPDTEAAVAVTAAASVLPVNAAAILVTENSVAIDPNANVPELSVLVFPRRGGFGDSGYVDSSWMSAYEDTPEARAELAQANTAAPGPKPVVAADPDAELVKEVLESEWANPVDSRPPSLRKSKIEFSAQDDLAELQAREDKLLAMQAAEAAVSGKDAVTKAATLSATVQRPAPAPVEHVAAEVVEPNPVVEPAVAAFELDAKAPPVPRTGNTDLAPDALFVAPEHAERAVESGKIEPALEAPVNYVQEMDAAVAAAPSTATVSDAEEPEFVRAARRKAFWSRPGVLLLTTLCAALLLAALALQVAVQRRDQLAVEHPALRPVLDRMCQLADCRVTFPREIQSVQIDSATLNPLGPNQFKLAIVLRNRADHPVAMPALELSLNDAAEKLVLRKVLRPEDVQAPPALAPNGEWAATIAVQVGSVGQEVVGYRVFAFYP